MRWPEAGPDHLSEHLTCASPEYFERVKEVHAHITEAGECPCQHVCEVWECQICTASVQQNGHRKRHFMDCTFCRLSSECAKPFEVFHQMQQGGVKLNQITYMSILNACAGPTSLDLGKEVHTHITEAGLLMYT